MESEPAIDIEQYTQGKQTIERTVSPIWANVLSLVLFIVGLAAFVLPYIWLWSGVQFSWGTAQMVWFVVATLVGIVAHEMIHGLGWLLFGRLSRQEIRFGIHPRYLMPYTHAKVPLKTPAYRLGALLPALATGLLPAVIGLVIGSFWLVLVGVTLFSGGSGDFMVLWALRDIPAEAEILDHPDKVGCLVLLDQKS